MVLIQLLGKFVSLLFSLSTINVYCVLKWWFFSVLAFLSHSWHGPFAFRWNCRSVLYVHHLRHWFDHGETDPRGIHRSPHNPLPRHGRSLPALVETPWWKGEAQRLRDQNWLFYIFVHFFLCLKIYKVQKCFLFFFTNYFYVILDIVALVTSYYCLLMLLPMISKIIFFIIWKTSSRNFIQFGYILFKCTVCNMYMN